MSPRHEHTLCARLAEARPLVLDGGLATELEARGFDLADPLWSARMLLEDPQAIRDVHRAYVEAGAELVIAGTYQATFEGFEARGIDRAQACRLFRAAVDLAREAGAPFVAASVGPYGAALANGAEYTGDYPGMDQAALGAWHRDRFLLLADSGADLLACETLPNAAEVRALCELAGERPDVPVWFSFSCRDGSSLRDGTAVRELAVLCAAVPNTVAIGVNCTAPSHLDALIGELAAASRLPIVVYPNSGEAYDAESHTWSGEHDATTLAAKALRWHALGARIIGGCCRTGPAYVRELATSFGHLPT